MKFNKMAACLVATACTATLFGAMTTASAAEELTIKAGSASAKAGDTFKIDIELAGVPSSGIAGLDFAIKYDASVFEVTSVTEGAASKTSDKQVEGFTSNLATDIAAGDVAVIWATGQTDSNASWIKSDGVLLTLNCKALKDGESEVEITKGRRKDAVSVDAVVEGIKVVNPSVKAGTVKVGVEETPSPSPSPSTPPVDTLYGDVSLDGKIDVTDLSTLSIAIADRKVDKLDPQAFTNADVDKSGTVTLSDLARIKQFVSHIIEKF